MVAGIKKFAESDRVIGLADDMMSPAHLGRELVVVLVMEKR